MSDEKAIDSNLEPINKDDFDLAKKFGHVEKIELDKRDNEAEPSFIEKEGAVEIVSAEKDSSYGKILSKITQKSDDGIVEEDVKNDAQIISKKMDAESQIQHLVDLVGTKGVIHAVKVAKHMDDNYVLDMLHDKIISEELHKVLVEKNLLPKE